jgi:hypothetical protein
MTCWGADRVRESRGRWVRCASQDRGGESWEQWRNSKELTSQGRADADGVTTSSGSYGARQGTEEAEKDGAVGIVELYT